jgi:hypothetical protein
VVCLSATYLTRPACQWELCQAYAAVPGPEVPERILVVRAGPLPSADLGVLADLRITRPAGDWAGIAAGIAGRVASLAGAIGSGPQVSVPSWPRAALTSPSFTGRSAELLELYRLLSPQAEIGGGRRGAHLPVIVSGMGGTGKTLLVEEYAARFAARYTGGVIRLSGRSKNVGRSAADPGEVLSSLLQQLLALSQAWPDPARDEAGAADAGPGLRAEVFRARETVRRQLAGPVLWVVDDLPPALPSEDFALFQCPDPELGVTVITSRSAGYGGLARSLELDCLPRAESVGLLSAHRPPQAGAETAAAHQIADALGGHPLALDVTGARLKLGPASYPEVAARLAGGSTLQEYEAIARSFRGELPTGHEASIVVTLSDSVAGLSPPAARILQLAAIGSPGTAVPARWAAEVLFGDEHGLAGALDEVTAAHLAKADATSYLTHVLVAALARQRLRTAGGAAAEEGIRWAALRWLAGEPPALMSEFSQVPETVTAAVGWHTLALLDEAVRYWDRSSAADRTDMRTASDRVGILLSTTGAEWQEKEVKARFARQLLAAAQIPDAQTVDVLTALTLGDDLSPFCQARIWERVVRMTEALPAAGRGQISGALQSYAIALRQAGLPGLALTAEQQRAALLEREAAGLEASVPGEVLTRSAVLNNLLTVLAGDADRELVTRHRLARLVHDWQAVLSDASIPALERGRAYHTIAEDLAKAGRPEKRAAFGALARLMQPVFDEQLAGGASREDLEPVYWLLTAALRETGEKLAVARIADLWFGIERRPEESAWAPGDPVDGADGMAEIRAFEALASRDGQEALARARQFIRSALAADYESPSRKAWLLWRIREALRGGTWGSSLSEEESREWTELQDSLSEICVDVALDYCRSAPGDPHYLERLSSTATLLMHTATGGTRGMLAAAEIFQTLAEKLAEVRGELASPTLAAWENAAESLDRADDGELTERASGIRSMLAERYGRAFAQEAQGGDLESRQLQFYLSRYVEYLRLSGQREAIVTLGRPLYRQAADTYGDGSETATAILDILADSASRAEIIDMGPPS